MNTMLKRVALPLIAVMMGMAGTAHADHSCQPTCVYKKVTTWETVITWEVKREEYTKEFVLYDHCDRPYTVTRTFFRDVNVPVKKVVPVTKIVKVCY